MPKPTRRSPGRARPGPRRSRSPVGTGRACARPTLQPEWRARSRSAVTAPPAAWRAASSTTAGEAARLPEAQGRSTPGASSPLTPTRRRLDGDPSAADAQLAARVEQRPVLHRVRADALRARDRVQLAATASRRALPAAGPARGRPREQFALCEVIGAAAPSRVGSVLDDAGADLAAVVHALGARGWGGHAAAPLVRCSRRRAAISRSR